MPFQLRCACGKNLNIKDEWVGKKIRCSNCNEVIAVSVPEDAHDDEHEMAVTAAPALKARPAPDAVEDEDDRPRSKKRRDDDDDDEDDRPRSKKRRDEDDDEDDDRPRSKKRRDEDDIGRRRPPLDPPGGDQTTANASIGMGILMMVGAIVWFVGGLFADIIFFYPPILFILGIAAVVRGALKRE